jgi:hypothetical protein
LTQKPSVETIVHVESGRDEQSDIVVQVGGRVPITHPLIPPTGSIAHVKPLGHPAPDSDDPLEPDELLLEDELPEEEPLLELDEPPLEEEPLEEELLEEPPLEDPPLELLPPEEEPPSSLVEPSPPPPKPPLEPLLEHPTTTDRPATTIAALTIVASRSAPSMSERSEPGNLPFVCGSPSVP